MSNLPRGVTVSFMTDDGAEIVFRIEGSQSYVGERLAAIGGHALLTLPLVEPGTERRFEYVQGEGAN